MWGSKEAAQVVRAGGGLQGEADNEVGVLDEVLHVGGWLRLLSSRKSVKVEFVLII